MKKLYAISLIAGLSMFSELNSTTLISSTVNNGGFESGATGWTITNGAQTNRWFIGTNYFCGGTQGAYVGTAVGNNNYTANAASTVHLYRDFTFPAGETDITLTFDFRGQGESTFDHMRVFLVSTATTPAAGTQLPVGSRIGNAQYNLVAGCTNYTITINGTAAGTTQRLVFQWRNDGSIGTNPAATLDNVTIITQVPPVPNCPTALTAPANGATGVCETSVTLQWTAPTGGGAPSGYKVYLGTNNFPTNVINGTNVGLVTSYSPGVLLPSTTYYWCIVPTNGAGDATGCTVYSFTTGAGCYVQPPAGTVSYTACGGSYYDPGGPSANYGNSQNSTVTFCPSVVGQYVQVTFSSFNLESCCDFLTVYNGNSTAAPVIGTFTGTTPPCNLVSSAVNGCLTFVFTSDGSVTYSGWTATVSCVAVPAGPLPGSICGNAPSIALPYTATSQTTLCYGNDYTNASTGSCGSLYESGEDRVYALTVGAATCIGITLSNASTTSIGYQVYSGCPGTAGTTCIGSNGGANPLSGTVVLPAAGTYYIIVDTWSAPNNATYDISVVNYGTGPANDLPCSATALALNTNLTGDNSCSGSASEPGTPACWTAGTMNTVWYSVVCPASGQLRIRTTVGTLTNTQIALYSGTCGSLTLVACNNDAPACGSSSYLNSEITATGLTGGATYWIRIDGANSLTGSFDVMAVDGAVGFPPAAGQDCSSPNPVCAASISIGDPGYQAYGNICDFPGGGGNCLASGERGSAWYTIPINAAGNLTFDIVPNDWPGAPSTASTDYDFAVWKIAGAGATNCAGIAAGAVPLRCNYSGLGVTGCYTTTGTAPPAYPGFGGAYEASIPVVAGEVYVLVVSNFSNSTSGFTLNFGGAAPINYTAAGSTVTWTGGTNTSWTLASNWGGCTPPICGISAVITPSSTNQPTVIAGNFYVNDLTINAGATLTLLAGANLHICGNFTNAGSILASPTSTITFDNASANHTMSGSFVGADALGNLVITQTGGSVLLNSNVDLKGNFTTSNATSVLNLNGRYLRVAGNFTNAAGNTTVTNTAGSTVEFNGTAAQTYNQGSSVLTLNNVLMNHTGPGVTCATNMVLGTSGVMTLTLGRLITNANEVQITNTASAACSAGNVNSFVQGNLRRYLNGGATAYDFPVGHATNGYQRANITFTSTTTIPQLVARFDTYGALPNGPIASECPSNTYNTLQVLNNGYWTISASANPSSGTYTTTLYNTNYTNSAGAAGWTVIKGVNTASYTLNGTCAAGTVNVVTRTGMNGFSVFGVGQSVAPLPVELVSFTGMAFEDHNRLEWITASEMNNDYFDIERSDDGINFFSIGRADGHGTTSMRNDYSFNDYSPIEGTNYYRLKQVDFNGSVTYSQIVTLEFHRGNMTVTNIKPNPTNGEVNFDFNSPLESSIHIVITDVTGRVVRDEFREVKAGTTLINTLIDQTGAGIYTLTVSEEKSGFRSVTRIVKF
jgi:hypothetical protein